MKTLHYYIIIIFATSLVVVCDPVFADDSTSYGGLTGYRQAYFQGNHGSYPIWYKLTNGTVVSTLLDLPAKALLFEINTTSNGQLTVDLPRTIIDSKNGSDDVPYFVGVYDIKSLGGPMKASPEEIDNEGVRTLKINFTKDITEIEIVGTFFVEKYHYAIPNSMSSLSPLQQYESGIAANDVTCRQGLQLIFKFTNGTPACVTSQTKEKLFERGWGTELEIIKVKNANASVAYRIDNGRILEVTAYGLSSTSSSGEISGSSILIVSMNAASNGTLIITMPRILIDAKSNSLDDNFTILSDGHEIQYAETSKTITSRTLSIPFQWGAKHIEIIGYGYYNKQPPPTE